MLNASVRSSEAELLKSDSFFAETTRKLLFFGRCRVVGQLTVEGRQTYLEGLGSLLLVAVSGGEDLFQILFFLSLQKAFERGVGLHRGGGLLRLGFTWRG